MRAAYAVVVEYRDPLGRIVEEVDSVYTSGKVAVQRRKAINADVERFPGMVADTREVTLHETFPAGLPVKHRYSHTSKLSVGDVLSIRERFAAGEQRGDLADAFSVSSQTISDILSGKTWRHV